jgi:hypothetical protein
LCVLQFANEVIANLKMLRFSRTSRVLALLESLMVLSPGASILTKWSLRPCCPQRPARGFTQHPLHPSDSVAFLPPHSTLCSVLGTSIHRMRSVGPRKAPLPWVLAFNSHLKEDVLLSKSFFSLSEHGTLVPFPLTHSYLTDC